MASTPGGSTQPTDGSTRPPDARSVSDTHPPDMRSVTPDFGPARKQLPAVPSGDMQTLITPKSAGDSRLTKQRGPLFLEYSLMGEYKQLEKQKLPGVYVVPSAKSPLCWNCVLFIRQGLYQGGVFKFLLHIPDNYPDGDCPRVVFEVPIFHPLIDRESGELDVKRGFQKWRRNVNHLWQVLLYARRVFYKIDTKSPLNPEAAVLYEHNPDIYKTNVAQTIDDCQQQMYDVPSTDDPHAIRFSRMTPDIQDEVKQQMLNLKKSPSSSGKSGPISGLSWMSPDASSVFSSPSASPSSIFLS